MGKLSSVGTQLQLAIATVYTTVAGVRSINGPNPETQFFDGTDLDSEHLEDGEPTGQSAPGSVTGELFYDPSAATHRAMISQITAPGTNGKAEWKIVWPDEDETAFVGTNRTFNPKASVGEGLLSDFDIKLSEMATFPAGTS